MTEWTETDPMKLGLLWAKAQLLLNANDVNVVRAGLECFGEEYVLEQDDPEEWLRERYAGEHKDEGDYAREVTEETGEIPEHLEFYVDWVKMERDWITSGDVSCVEIEGARYYFHNS